MKMVRIATLGSNTMHTYNNNATIAVLPDRFRLLKYLCIEAEGKVDWHELLIVVLSIAFWCYISVSFAKNSVN